MGSPGVAKELEGVGIQSIGVGVSICYGRGLWTSALFECYWLVLWATLWASDMGVFRASVLGECSGRMLWAMAMGE